MNVNDLRGNTIGFLASGGLDSCTITRWLTDEGVRVLALTANLGQPDEKSMDDIRNRMLACGAVDAVVVDAREALAEAGWSLIQAQATYEDGYWNTTGMARHVTVKAALEGLKQRGISVLSHGATGRGNDQVRFQLCTNMLDPTFRVYAPWRDELFLARFSGREQMIEFCQQRGLPVRHTKAKPYSTDANLLGLTHEAGKLEELTTPVDLVQPEFGVFAKDAPNQAEPFTVRFEAGRPVAVNGRPATVLSAFEAANAVAGRHGVGIGLHLVENRFVGVKSRGVYEQPGIELLGKCYLFMLQVVLDRRARDLFDQLSRFLARQVYQGYGFDLGSQMAMAAVRSSAQLVTGTVTVSLYKGSIIFQSLQDAPHSIYSAKNSSMENVGDFDHADSEGFVGVLGVSARMLAQTGQVCNEKIPLLSPS